MKFAICSRKCSIVYWLVWYLSFDQTAAFSIELSRRIATTALKSSDLSDWSLRAGDSALRQVQRLASKVAESTAAAEEESTMTRNTKLTKGADKMVQGIGGAVYNNPEFNRNMDENEGTVMNTNIDEGSGTKRQDQVWVALANLELDSE
jgi:hypothetical protein